jgi:hypothetical protein
MKVKTIGAIILGVVITVNGEIALADSEFSHNQEQESDGAWGWKPKESDGNDGPAPGGGSSFFDDFDGGGDFGGSGGSGGFGGFGTGGSGGAGSALMNAGFLTLITSMLQSSGSASGRSDDEASTIPTKPPSDPRQQEDMDYSTQKTTS